jgi:hypothetical protein
MGNAREQHVCQLETCTRIEKWRTKEICERYPVFVCRALAASERQDYGFTSISMRDLQNDLDEIWPVRQNFALKVGPP